MVPIRVEQMAVGPLGTNCYIVVNERTGECIIADPGGDAQRIMAQVGDRKPCAVLLTHAHWDHIGAVDELCAHYGVPLYVHRADAPKLQDMGANVATLFGVRVAVLTQPDMLVGGETLRLGGMDIGVLHTPGHSAGSVCYLLPRAQGVLTGDTLFAHGYGRTDFPDGSFMQLKESLRALFHLSPKQSAYPGHGETGVVGRDEEGA